GSGRCCGTSASTRSRPCPRGASSASGRRWSPATSWKCRWPTAGTASRPTTSPTSSSPSSPPRPTAPGSDSRSSTGSCRSTAARDRKSTRLNSSHVSISYAVFCLKKKKKKQKNYTPQQQQQQQEQEHCLHRV